jgi:SAM-dependent methyltransferase
MIMVTKEKILKTNKETYENLYSKREAFLRYPADWVIRFHNMYMRDNLNSGRVLDYGCGSANNSVFFIKQGYEVWGVDVAKNFKDLVEKNFTLHHIDKSLLDNFFLTTTDDIELPFEDGFFDFIISNQVLYYLSSEERIKKVCKELYRCLRPGGVVFFTVMGPRNYYMTEKTKKIHGKVHEIEFDDPKHRLFGLKEMIYLVETEKELKELFSDFECITTGYFDQRMFDVTSNCHWIFAGKKK